MKVSKCIHCHTENPDYWDQACLSCGFHPWNVCDHPDCGKLPPVKHTPKQPPARPRNPS